MTGLDATIARALACTTCDADPSAAPGRYCASLACRCGHPACPAAASWVPREGASGKIGSKQDGSQPRCVNTSTGSLTADSTPAIPGGISG